MRRISRAQPGNVEVQLLEIDAVLPHDLRDDPLAFGMMDELRLQFSKDGRDLLGGLLLMDRSWVVRCKGFAQHAAGELDQGTCAVGGRQYENVAGVQPLAPGVVCNGRIDKDRTHGETLLLWQTVFAVPVFDR